MEHSVVYEDFELLFERSGDTYRACVIRSPSGEAPEQVFNVPFSDEVLENLVLKLQRSRGKVRGIDALEPDRVKEFGGQLYEALFRDDLRTCFRRSLDATRSRGHGLRLRLRLGDCPPLLDVPWEFLYDRSHNLFVCLSHLTPVVRYLQLDQGPAPLEVTVPLRILVMISDPLDYDRLDVGKEWSNLKDAVRPLQQSGQLTLELLPAATLHALQQALRRADYHIFHFIGHGGFDEVRHDGVLILENDDRNGVRVSGQVIGAYLSDHPALRLAVLNACEGGRSDLQDPFAGVAQTLVQQGIPAVIAMQFEITDTAAIIFAKDFYASIVDGFPVDAALAEARKAIYGQPNPFEWATPVLYMRSADGTLFHVQPSTASPSPAAGPVVPGPTRPPADGLTGESEPAGHDEQSDREASDQASLAGTQLPGRRPDGTADITATHGQGLRPTSKDDVAVVVPAAAVEQVSHVGGKPGLSRPRLTVISVGAGIAVIGLLAVFHFLVLSPAASACRPSQSAWTTEGGVYSRPSVARDGTVYVGSTDNLVYAFNSAGAVCWVHNTGSPIYTSPVLSQRALYISNSSNIIYALNARTGRKEWAQSIGSTPESLTLDGTTGILYVGTYDGTVFALNTRTHQLAWPPRNTGSRMEFDSPPVVSGSYLYVCNNSGTLYALSAATGAVRWKFATKDLGYCGLAVNADNGDVYFATSRSKVRAFKSNGSPAWSHAFSAGPTDSASPTVNRAGNLVYVGSSNGTVYALYASNGHQAWARSIGQLIYQSSPTQFGPFVYVGTYDGYIYRLNASSGNPSSCYVGGQIGSSPNFFRNTVYMGNVDNRISVINQSKKCRE